MEPGETALAISVMFIEGIFLTDLSTNHIIEAYKLFNCLVKGIINRSYGLWQTESPKLKKKGMAEPREPLRCHSVQRKLCRLNETKLPANNLSEASLVPIKVNGLEALSITKQQPTDFWVMGIIKFITKDIGFHALKSCIQQLARF